MKNYKIAAFSLLSSTLFLTSCSSSSCYNPCNWKPFWKKSCYPVCCEEIVYCEEPVCHPEPACCPEPVRCPAPSCNASPYPDTSIEDVPTPAYLRQEPIDTKDVPYYDDSYPDHQAPSPGQAPAAKPAPKQTAPVKSTPAAPSQPAPAKENLDHVKQEHQKVLSRYKKTQPEDDPISAEDAEYFDRIVQRVMSKDKQSN